MVPKMNFKRTLWKHFELKIDDIDLEILCQVYKDKMLKRSVRYLPLVDDLTEMAKRNGADIVLLPESDQAQSPEKSIGGSSVGKDKSKEAKEVEDILGKLKQAAHDNSIDLQVEFKK